MALEFVSTKSISVKLQVINEILTAEAKHGENKHWSGPLSGLTLAKFKFYFESARFLIRKYIFVDAKTLKVKYVPGLLGSGEPTSYLDPKMKHELETNYVKIDENLLKENQEQTRRLVISISRSIENLSIEKSDIDRIRDLNPYELWDSYDVSKIILEIIELERFWDNGIKNEDKAALIKVEKKLLYAHLLKNHDEVLFRGEKRKFDIINNLNSLINKVEKNVLDFSQCEILINLIAIKQLSANLDQLQSIWKSLVCSSVECASIAFNYSKKVSGYSFVSLLNSFDTISIESESDYSVYIMMLEAYETVKISTYEELDALENFIFREVEKCKYKERDFQMYFLLDFIQNSISKNDHSLKFKKEIARVLYRLDKNTNEKVIFKRESVLDTIFLTTVSVKKEIPKSIIIQPEETKIEQMRVQKITMKNPSNKSRSDLKISNIEELFYDFEEPIDRKNEVEKIHELLKENQALVVTGVEGTGKTDTVLQYCKYYATEYDIMWLIKQEKWQKDLTSLASSLGVGFTENYILDLQAALKNLEESKILLVFDNFNSRDDLVDFSIASQSIKYLITSRINDWDKVRTIDVQPFVEEKANEYVKKYLGNILNEADLKKVATKISGWAIGLDESICSIRNNELSVAELEEGNYIIPNSDLERVLDSICASLNSECKLLLEIMKYFGPINILQEMLMYLFDELNDKRNWLAVKQELIRKCIVLDYNEQKYLRIHYALNPFIEYKNLSNELNEIDLIAKISDFTAKQMEKRMDIEMWETAFEIMLYVETTVKRIRNHNFKSARLCANLLCLYVSGKLMAISRQDENLIKDYQAKLIEYRDIINSMMKCFSNRSMTQEKNIFNSTIETFAHLNNIDLSNFDIFLSNQTEKASHSQRIREANMNLSDFPQKITIWFHH
jgi:hypothetical protein